MSGGMEDRCPGKGVAEAMRGVMQRSNGHPVSGGRPNKVVARSQEGTFRNSVGATT